MCVADTALAVIFAGLIFHRKEDGPENLHSIFVSGSSLCIPKSNIHNDIFANAVSFTWFVCKICKD